MLGKSASCKGFFFVNYVILVFYTCLQSGKSDINSCCTPTVLHAIFSGSVVTVLDWSVKGPWFKFLSDRSFVVTCLCKTIPRM